MHNFKEQLKDVKVDMENQGEKLVITLSGDKEKLAKLERKLKAIHELMEDCECGCGGNCC